MNTFNLIRMVKSSSFILILIALNCISVAQAKCAMREYTFLGDVHEKRTSKPIGNASIFIFLDQQGGTYAQGYSTRYPDFFTTDSAGHVEATAYFDTFNYSEKTATGEICDRTPKTIEIILVKEGYVTQRVVYEFKLLNDKSTDKKPVFELPALDLSPVPW